MIEVTLTYRQISEFWPAVDKLFGDKKQDDKSVPMCSLSLRLRFARTAAVLLECFRRYQHAERNLVSQFVVDLPDGHQKVPADKIAQFEEEKERLLSTEVEVPFPDKKITKSEFKQLELNCWEMAMLLDYFCEPDVTEE